MSIPIGAKWIYAGKSKIGVRLSDGSVVTRSQGERMGAAESGYKNPNQEKRATAQRSRFLSSSSEYQAYLKRARVEAKRNGVRFDARSVGVAYWRAHTAGKIMRASNPRTASGIAAQKELQRAMTALGKITGNVNYAWPKGSDTP